MKKILCTLMLAIASILTIPSHAQTTTKYLLGAHPCGSFTNNYYCDGIPFTRWDGSQPQPSNGDAFTPPIPAYVFSDLLYNGRVNGFFFLTNDGLDINGPTGNVVSVIDVPAPNAPVGVQQVTATLKGANYTGTVTFLYTKGKRSCGGRTCVTPWQILSGYVEVTK
jgi:hypothetical protein